MSNINLRSADLDTLYDLAGRLEEAVSTLRYDDQIKQATIDAGEDCTVEVSVVIRRLAHERDVLLAGLRLYKSMPVEPNGHGYACSDCGAPLAEAHGDDCVWVEARDLLIAHRSAPTAPIPETPQS